MLLTLSLLLLGSVWTDEVSCTVLNSTVVGLVNCSYSCGPECRRSSSYPCLQVYVSLNSTGRVLLLLHDEETQDGDPQVPADPAADFPSAHLFKCGRSPSAYALRGP